MRLIDADITINMLRRSSIWKWPLKEALQAQKWAIDIINEMPTIDAVEVVRCKECKYRGYIAQCPMIMRLRKTLDKSYCSYGERREP